MLIKRCKGCWERQRDSLHPISEFGESGQATYCSQCRQERKQQSRSQVILNRVALGYTDQEIADELQITRKAVGKYLQSVRAKTGIRSRILLSFYALGKGIVTQDEIRAAISKEKCDRKVTR